MRKILSYLRKAVEDYNMIEEGDKIAVGVSGGKDSIVLLYALKKLQLIYPKKFDILGITLDMGFDNFDPKPIVNFCSENNIDYEVIKTDIKEIVFDIRNEKSPCSLCSKMRRGALNEEAKKRGCNKVALGHHNDDVIETYYLCTLYEGRIGTFSPVTHLDRIDIHQIRPLIYARESEIKNTAARLDLPIVKNPCPADGTTKRQEIKDIISHIERNIHGSRERLFGAIIRSGIDGWGINK